MILTIFKCIGAALVIVSFGAASAPRTEQWTLTDDTKKVLYVAPDLGTRFLFPFDLNDEQFNPRLEFTNTSPFFHTVPDLSKGNNLKVLQNSFTVTVDRKTVINLVDEVTGKIKAPLLGYIFVSVGRYNLTLELRATTNIEKHIANVRFDISPEEREYLISESVNRKSKRLEEEYKKRLLTVDKLAEERALALIGDLSAIRPDIVKVRDTFELATQDGHKLEIEIDDFQIYDKFTTLQIIIANLEREKLFINELKLLELQDEKRKRIDIFHKCKVKVESHDSVNCVITTKHKNVADLEKMIFVIETNQGTGEVSW